MHIIMCMYIITYRLIIIILLRKSYVRMYTVDFKIKDTLMWFDKLFSVKSASNYVCDCVFVCMHVCAYMFSGTVELR